MQSTSKSDLHDVYQCECLKNIHPPRSCIPYRCRANMTDIRQSRPGSGLGFAVKVLDTDLSWSVFGWTRMQMLQMGHLQIEHLRWMSHLQMGHLQFATRRCKWDICNGTSASICNWGGCVGVPFCWSSPRYPHPIHSKHTHSLRV